MFPLPETGFLLGTCGHKRSYQRKPKKGQRNSHLGNRTEVKSFLGLVSCYHRFVPDFSTVAQPLYKLIDAKTEFVWTGECQVAFDSLKGSLLSARMLVYPNREGTFVLDTPTYKTMKLGECCHCFKVGWKDLLHLQVAHCLCLRGTIV